VVDTTVVEWATEARQAATTLAQILQQNLAN
jgi:hypothetical protein